MFAKFGGVSEEAQRERVWETLHWTPDYNRSDLHVSSC